MKVLTKDLIKVSENNAVHNGIFSFLELMKIAGDKAFSIITKEYALKSKSVAVICSNGNNGGDGFVIAKNLKNLGANVTIILPLGEPLTESSKFYYEMIKEIPKTNIFEDSYDFLIDAVFGIGLNRDLSPKICALFEEINKSNAIKISIDIPSGIECDSGKILGACIKSDLCITFIAQKPCFMLPPATDYIKRVVVADIGVPPCDFAYETIEKPIFEARKPSSHKGTFGTALLICGSYGMLGALILSAKACLRSGVGIAKCLMPKSIYEGFTTAVPEAVCLPSKQTLKGTINSSINLKKAARKVNAILIGCGLGNNFHTRRLVKKLLKNTNLPIVIDADGINAISGNIDILKKTNASVILTPHPAEMARLVNGSVKDIEQNRTQIAMDFAKEYNCHLVLKGANTIVATPSGQIFFNTCGNPGLATGGSGDVLAGIIVSLLAQGFDITKAVTSAVYLHSEAADKVKSQKGERALLPSDIIEAL